MAKKKRSRTSDFSLMLGKNTGTLPSKEEIDNTVAKATNQEAQLKIEEKKAKAKIKRIPFTTAITPENRATLEAAAHEGKGSVADLLNKAVEHYFANIDPLEDEDMKKVFLKIFEKKAK